MAWAEFYRCSSSRRTPHKGPIRRLSEFHPRRNYIPAKVDLRPRGMRPRIFQGGPQLARLRFSFSRRRREGGGSAPSWNLFHPLARTGTCHAKFIRTPPTNRSAVNPLQGNTSSCGATAKVNLPISKEFRAGRLVYWPDNREDLTRVSWWLINGWIIGTIDI